MKSRMLFPVAAPKKCVICEIWNNDNMIFRGSMSNSQQKSVSIRHPEYKIHKLNEYVIQASSENTIGEYYIK